MAWYEYKYLSLPRQKADKDWPHVEKLKTAFRRRARMFELIGLKAKREGRMIEALIEAMTASSQGQEKTMNRLLSELTAEAKANKSKEAS
ncbi:hypothetical protein BGZ96_006055, partial [Linnemannia gamsii]